MWIPPWPRFLRDLHGPELPKAYPRQGEEAFKAEKETILQLMDLVSQEMEAHRRRQAWIFREAIGFIGILTWAAISAPAVRSGVAWVSAFVGGTVAAACIMFGFVGRYIILLYRQRIYHLRKRREKLASYVRPEWEDERGARAGLQQAGDNGGGGGQRAREDLESRYNRATWLFPPIGPPVSSVAFAWMLPPIGLAAATLNLAAIGLTYAPAPGQAEPPSSESIVHVDGQLTVKSDSPPAGGTDRQTTDPPATLNGL